MHPPDRLIFLALIHLIVILLLWSFFLASFTSPGYPSEILETMHGRSKRSIFDGDSVHDDVHVGLLEHGQYSLTHSPISAASSARPGYPHSPSAMVTSDATSSGYSHIPTGHGGGVEGIDAYERREREGSGTMESPFDHGHRVSDAWGQHHRPSSRAPTFLHPPSVSPSSHSHPHTVVSMMTGDDCTDSTTLRNASVDADDHSPLGITSQRFTVKMDGSMRYCQKCNSSCKRCVLKMDHHCPWLNNCVGHRNHKAFYLFVLWTAAYCVTIVACTIPVVADAFSHPYEATFTQTTIESLEKQKYRMGSTGEVLQSRMLNVFDIGAKKNFVQVLGPVWYLWFIPVRNSLGDGWSFPANEYGKNLLRSTQQDVYSGHSTLVKWPQSLQNHNLGYLDHVEDPPQSQRCDSSDLDENAYHRRDSDSDLDDPPRFRPRTPRRKFYRRYQGYMYNNHNNNQGAGFLNTAAASPLGRPRLGAGTKGSSEDDDDDDDDDDDGQDIEPEEYIYDSDEQATIRFTER
ncbi:hypothetical protein BGZ73_002140 [Actinomortierella ambigua]|nr:hypothetical protein BGZ73_002140 [Actinomortierella ambigua]